jgi:hypothetical protein
MNICGTEYTRYDLVCAGLAVVVGLIVMIVITTFYFFTLVVFGGPHY